MKMKIDKNDDSYPSLSDSSVTPHEIQQVIYHINTSSAYFSIYTLQQLVYMNS